MSYRASLALLLMLFIAGSFVHPVSAQFGEEEPEQGFSEDDGSPADRDDRRGRGERGDRGDRGGRSDREDGRDRGEGGFRGRGPRPNPLFEALDVDGDGFIDRREIGQARRNLLALDADDDGSISLEEVSPMRGPGGPGGFGDPEAMLARWMENDGNGDGVLTQDEVPEFMARMLTGADTNGDGAFDRDELQQAMQNMRDNFGRGANFGGAGGGGGPGGGGFGGGFDNPDTMTKQIIARADQNRDGTISEDEMDPRMRGMLQGADADGNGVLDAGEIRLYMETARQRMEQFRAQGGGRERFDPRAGRRGRDQEQE